VGLLVQDGGGLILVVASTGQTREIAEEEGAIGDVVVGRESVGEHTGRATTIDISAYPRCADQSSDSFVNHGMDRSLTVSTSSAAGSRTTIGSNSSQACGNSAADARRSRLEVLTEGASGPGGGSSGGSGCQSLAVAESGADSAQAGATAITLDNGALRELADCALNLGCLSSINVNRELVAGESKSTSSQSSGVELSIGNGSSSKDIVLSAGGKLVQFGEFNLNLNRLTSHDGLEDILAKLAVSKALHDTGERSLVF
jgi:hypothetical protein